MDYNELNKALSDSWFNDRRNYFDYLLYLLYSYETSQ